MTIFSKYKLYILLVFLISLTSCLGTKPPTFISGNYLTTEHATMRTKDAITGAQEYCSSIGKNFRLLSTDCPTTCVSNFECVD